MFSNTNSTIEVKITMADGAILAGHLAMGTNATLAAVLSYNAPFLDFTGKDGQKRFISKQSAAIIEPVEQLRKPTLDPRTSDNSDPYQVLRVTKDADVSTIRQTYLDLAKQYHPDTYSNITLPKEVDRYVGDMFRQINAAYIEIKAEKKTADEEVAA